MTNEEARPPLSKVPPPVLYTEEERVSGCRVPLEHPITHGGESIDVIEFAPLNGYHVRQLPDDPATVDGFLKVAELLTLLPESTIDQLQGDDIGLVMGAAQGSLWSAIDLPNLGKNADGEVVTVENPKLVAPYTLTLPEPITDEKAKETVRELVFRPATGKIARSFSGQALRVNQVPKLVEKLTGASSRTVDQLTGEALREALGVASCFFASIRPRQLPGSGAP